MSCTKCTTTASPGYTPMCSCGETKSKINCQQNDNQELERKLPGIVGGGKGRIRMSLKNHHLIENTVRPID